MSSARTSLEPLDLHLLDLATQQIARPHLFVLVDRNSRLIISTFLATATHRQEQYHIWGGAQSC